MKQIDEDGSPQGSIASMQQFVSDVSVLIRRELELAKAELSEKIKSAGVGAGMISASAVTGMIALGCLTALLILLIALVLPAWIAALIVTLFWAAVTAILALLGKRKVEEASPFVPEQTIEDLKEDIASARQSARKR